MSTKVIRIDSFGVLDAVIPSTCVKEVYVYLYSEIFRLADKMFEGDVATIENDDLYTLMLTFNIPEEYRDVIVAVIGEAGGILFEANAMHKRYEAKLVGGSKSSLDIHCE